MMKVMKILLCGLMLAVPVLANETEDRQTATSLKYVTHELDTRQDKLEMGADTAIEYTDSAGDVAQRTVESNLSGANDSLPTVSAVTDGLNQKQNTIATINDHTAVTYTGQAGGISTKGIYQPSGTYAEQTNNLIDAKTFNAALKTGLDNEFVCDEDNKSSDGICWLWKIHTIGSSLPPEYTELEYIESSGTQYIDTGYAFNTEHKFILNVKPSTDSLSWFFGANHTYGEVIIGKRPNMYFGGLIGSGENVFPTSKYYNIIMDTNRTNTSFIVDNNIIFTGSKTFNPRNVLLFAFIGSAISKVSIQISKFQVYQKDGTLVQNLIPAIQNSDNKIGMYDTVSGTFFENAGTGTFTDGPEVHSNVYVPQNQQ